MGVERTLLPGQEIAACGTELAAKANDGDEKTRVGQVREQHGVDGTQVFPHGQKPAHVDDLLHADFREQRDSDGRGCKLVDAAPQRLLLAGYVVGVACGQVCDAESVLKVGVKKRAAERDKRRFQLHSRLWVAALVQLENTHGGRRREPK